MASQTRNSTNTTIDAFDNNCLSRVSVGTMIDSSMSAGSIDTCSTITDYDIYARIDCEGTGESPVTSWKFSVANGGSTYCSGHTTSPAGTEGRTCGTTGFTLYSADCGHSEGVPSVTQWNGGNVDIFVEVTAMDAEVNTAFLNHLYHGVSYNDTVPPTAGVPTVYSLTTTHITIQKPSTPGNYGVTHWRTRRGGVVESGDIVIATTTYEWGPFSPGTGSQFDVQFKNTCGTYYGSYGADLLAWTLCSTVAKPTVAIQGDEIIRISWGDVTGGDNYRIRRNNTTILTSTDQGTPYDDNTVVAGNSYVYDIQVQNLGGYWNTYSVDSDSITAVGLPDAPVDPSITADGVGTATVSCDEPNMNGGNASDIEIQIDDDVTFNDGNGRRQTWVKGSDPSDPQTHQFTGCTADILYYARARYENEAGWGPYNASPYNSDTIWDQSNEPVWASPKFTARTSSSISFDWETPTDLGNCNLIEYDYQWKIDGGSYATVDTNSTNTYATKSTLSGGTKYWFEARAVTQWGDGVWNTEDYHWTLCIAPTISDVVANAIGQLRVTWSTVTGVDAWNLERSDTGSWTGEEELVEANINPSILYWDDGSRGNGFTWYYRLNADNADDNASAWSTPDSGTTWDNPAAPTNVDVNSI